MSEQLRALMQQIGPRVPALQAVYLFGSVAKGRARQRRQFGAGWAGQAAARKYLALLQALVEAGPERANSEHYGRAEHFLQRAIEALNDRGGHVVAGLQLRQIRWVRDYRDLDRGLSTGSFKSIGTTCTRWLPFLLACWSRLRAPRVGSGLCGFPGARRSLRACPRPR